MCVRAHARVSDCLCVRAQVSLHRKFPKRLLKVRFRNLSLRFWQMTCHPGSYGDLLWLTYCG